MVLLSIIFHYIYIKRQQNIIYIIQFLNGWSYEISTHDIYLTNINDKLELQLLENRYPQCLLNADTVLEINLLITTLGGNKDLTSVSESQPDIGKLPLHLYLLQQTIDSTNNTDKIIQRISEYLSGNFEHIQMIPENWTALEVKNVLNSNLSGIFNKIAWDNVSSLLSETSSQFENKFYQNYINVYNEIKNNNYINIEKNINNFNKNFKDIILLSNWTPALTNCLIEPMKIIINFGKPTTEIKGINTTFDIDIKVNINDPLEKNNAVGWRCGSINTKYLSWLSGDEQFGGPEIVLVDIDTYKMYNKDKKTLEILVNACLYEYSQLETQQIFININWKGYLYLKTFKNLPYNVGCCENLLLKITVDLENNFISSEPEIVYFVPVVTTYGNPENPDFNMSIGYVKLFENDIEKIPMTYSFGNKKYNFMKNLKTYDIDNFNLVRTVVENYYLTYHNQRLILKNIISESFVLNWEDKLKLNYKGFNINMTIFNFEQIFIKHSGE